MDPLSALSVAAAVVQFVDFGQRLFSETWHIYRSATGQDLVLEELKVVSRDISQLASAVEDTLNLHRGEINSVSNSMDVVLLRVCNECAKIASEVQAVLLKADKSFHRELNKDEAAVSIVPSGYKVSRSVGECFRLALKTWWKGRKVDEIRQRLNDARQQIIMAMVMSIWHTFRDTKSWEQQFSSKLDTMITRLDQAIEKTVNLGPGRVIHDTRYRNELDFRPKEGRGEGIGLLEPSATESIRQNIPTQEIIDRLWSKDWECDESLFLTFPQQTSVSPGYLKSFIMESLRFNSMENREEAIAITFSSTYQWVFTRTPKLSDDGEPMWSSLPDWLEGDSQLPFWITGKPGSGKSTMMKNIVNYQLIDQHLSRWAQGFPIFKIRYYAWNAGFDLEKSEEGLLRTLLYQVLEKDQDLTPVLCPRRWALFFILRDLHTKTFPAWSSWELHESFNRLLGLIETKMRLIVFIDGLDEFEIAPNQLCKLVQDISQHRAIKVCVASRSWPQFSDAFANSPGVQMHLLTHDDIKKFVIGHFHGLIAFSELNALYQNGGDGLLEQVVSKSHGVFLWTALVTQTLLQELIEGASLVQLYSTLDKMPVEIKDLYGAIYASIPNRLLPEASAMLQMYVLACGAVDCMTLWLADESRASEININPWDINEDQIFDSLKRRLSARTRGILEAVKSTQTVEYLHRTAAEWIKRPSVWENLCAASPSSFDPHMCLFRAEIIRLQNSEDVRPSRDNEFWGRVNSSLFYVSLVDSGVTSETVLIQAIDDLHRAASDCVHPEYTVTWPSCQSDGHYFKTYYPNSFNSLAVQFAVLPYVRHTMEEFPSTFHTVPPPNHKAILEKAIFGFVRFSSSRSITGIDPTRKDPLFSKTRNDSLSFEQGGQTAWHLGINRQGGVAHRCISRGTRRRQRSILSCCKRFTAT